MVKHWKFHSFDPDTVAALESAAKIPNVVAQLLISRGMSDPQAVHAFLHMKLSDLRKPGELPGAENAAKLIFQAVQDKKRIQIYGDYDADGMTATAILVRCLKLLGADVGYFAPNRMDDGYGLNSDVLRRLHQEGTQMVISVDCGIANAEQADVAADLGLQLVITDHHEFGDRLPAADAIVHPRLPGTDYPFGGLCGAGVAFKLAWILCQLDSDADRVTAAHRDFLMMAIGIAAIGTVTDVVPLLDENRIIVTHGLHSLKDRACTGVQALKQITKINNKPKLQSDDIGFNLGPRLNAAGRLGQAALGVELLATDDPQRAQELATYLDQLNENRKTIERSIHLAAVKQIKENYDAENDPAFVLAGHGWHAGVIGVVSGRLAEKYARPVILIALDQLAIKPGIGSARSGGLVNLHTTLQQCTEHLEKHGGHAAAAGLTIAEGNVDAFRAAFCEQVAETLREENQVAELLIDAEAPFAQLTTQIVEQIHQLAPFGKDNPRPILCASRVEIIPNSARRMGGGERHLTVTLSQSSVKIRCVAFGQGDWAEELDQTDGPIDIAYKPVINDFRGQRKVELHLQDWRPSS
ncbi:MAG: single-stranded-DNA-specific exonuclease RecJ [Planctomycetota bacterium]|nr:single-stranded-DNA-specific exonuclease RecJ [Planctomycetota bacterium]